MFIVCNRKLYNVDVVFLLFQYLDDCNMASSKEMKLVFFMDAVQHVARLVLNNLHPGNTVAAD